MKNLMRAFFGLLVVGLLFSFCYASSSRVSDTPVVLVTGFEPFGNYSVNPSQLITEALNGSTLMGVTVVGIVLPVNFTSSVEMTIHAVEQYHPVVVISLGLNARATAIEVEKIGINLKRYPKDDGTWSFPRRIDAAGPFLRLTSLHTKEIVKELQKADISAQQSYSAGTYVCNTLFYQLLGYSNTHNVSKSIGFIHVPLLDSQDPEGMPLQSMVDAVKIAIQTSLEDVVS